MISTSNAPFIPISLPPARESSIKDALEQILNQIAIIRRKNLNPCDRSMHKISNVRSSRVYEIRRRCNTIFSNFHFFSWIITTLHQIIENKQTILRVTFFTFSLRWRIVRVDFKEDFLNQIAIIRSNKKFI